MTMFAVGVVITVILLVGFGFFSTASAGWFFKNQKPQETFAGGSAPTEPE